MPTVARRAERALVRRGQEGPTLRARSDKYSRELYEDSDFDVVDESNLQRQVIHGTSTVGKLKVGNGVGDGVTTGPLINAAAVKKVEEHIADAKAKGGKVVDKAWVPLGTKDYASVIAKIPKDIDALVVVLGGSDAVNFLTQYQQAGGTAPLIGGSITADQTVLGSKGGQRKAVVAFASW